VRSNIKKFENHWLTLTLIVQTHLYESIVIRFCPTFFNEVRGNVGVRQSNFGASLLTRLELGKSYHLGLDSAVPPYSLVLELKLDLSSCCVFYQLQYRFKIKPRFRIRLI